LLQNISNKAKQYASSDVLMSKVSPTSAAEANPKSAGVDVVGAPVIDIEIKDHDIVSANFLKTAEAAADMQEHISIYDGKDEVVVVARPQSNRLEHGQHTQQKLICQPSSTVHNGHMNLQENHTSSLLITPELRSRNASQHGDQGAADGLDCKGGSTEIKDTETPDIDVSQLKKIRQKKEALARHGEMVNVKAIEIKGKKIDKNTMMNIINNRSNNLSRASVSPSNVNDSHFLNESPQGHTFIRTEKLNVTYKP